jgi:hypothetical protein
MSIFGTAAYCKLAISNWQTGNWKLETGNWKLELETIVGDGHVA